MENIYVRRRNLLRVNGKDVKIRKSRIRVSSVQASQKISPKRRLMWGADDVNKDSRVEQYRGMFYKGKDRSEGGDD